MPQPVPSGRIGGIYRVTVELSCEGRNGNLRDELVVGQIKRDLLMRFKSAIISLAVLACAIGGSVFTAAPSLARDHHVYRHHHYSRVPQYRDYSGYRDYRPGYRDYSGYLDPGSGHYDLEFQRNREDFGFSGRDPSRVGGEDPTLHPGPY